MLVNIELGIGIHLKRTYTLFGQKPAGNSKIRWAQDSKTRGKRQHLKFWTLITQATKIKDEIPQQVQQRRKDNWKTHPALVSAYTCAARSLYHFLCLQCEQIIMITGREIIFLFVCLFVCLVMKNSMSRPSLPTLVDAHVHLESLTSQECQIHHDIPYIPFFRRLVCRWRRCHGRCPVFGKYIIKWSAFECIAFEFEFEFGVLFLSMVTNGTKGFFVAGLAKDDF